MGRFEVCLYGWSVCGGVLRGVLGAGVIVGCGSAPSLCLSPGGGEIGKGSIFPRGGEIGGRIQACLYRCLVDGGEFMLFTLTPALSLKGEGVRVRLGESGELFEILEVPADVLEGVVIVV